MEEIQRGLQPLLKPGQKLSLEEQVGRLRTWLFHGPRKGWQFAWHHIMCRPPLCGWDP